MNQQVTMPRLFWGSLLAAAAFGLVGCDAAPTTDLTVTTVVDGSDAAPGDGVCEMTSGLGDCSLRAAIDEANNAGTTVVKVTVPIGVYSLNPGSDDTNVGGDLDLAPSAGTVSIFSQGTGDVVIDAAGGDSGLDIHSGTAIIVGVGVTEANGSAVHVRSGATASFGFATVVANGGPGFAVDPGATLAVFDTTVFGNGGGGGTGGISNAGTLDLKFVTVSKNTGGGIGGAGSTTAAMSIVADQLSGPNCATAITSGGGNLASDVTCGLTGPADLSDTPAQLATMTADLHPVLPPLPGSPAIDAVPLGTGECRTDGVGRLDQRLTPRPIGASCDRGAVEADLATQA